MGYTLKYYDLVLVGIIAPLGVGGAVGALTAVAMPVAIVALGAVSVGVMGHALFVNGPVDRPADLTQEVEDGPVKPEKIPLVE
ncbi:hypothetical protein [Natronomonas marina]|jgi:hypothetical protein|uniref:hypothetical protein n=1 Tax=Natronomonas marina TaxID=2961939 RepID=UPI0020C947C7|nr:hypothetical protein [Natronomonas marina]